MVRSVNQLLMMTRNLRSASNLAGRLSASGGELQCDRVQIDSGKVVSQVIRGYARTEREQTDKHHTACREACRMMVHAGPALWFRVSQS
jgi:hypothetical protein